MLKYVKRGFFLQAVYRIKIFFLSTALEMKWTKQSVNVYAYLNAFLTKDWYYLYIFSQHSHWRQCKGTHKRCLSAIYSSSSFQ